MKYLFLLGALIFLSIGRADPLPLATFPFSLEGGYLTCAPAHFSKQALEKEHLSFARAESRLNYTYPLNTSLGLLMGAGYEDVEIDWRQNPFFSTEHFGYIHFALGCYTTAFEPFLLSGSLSVFFDTEVLDLADYTLYEAVFFAEHRLSDTLAFQVGFIAEAGLNNDKIWPIIGFEWDADGPFRIGAVYPLDIAIEYRFSQMLSLAGALRFLHTRHRLRSQEPLSRGIFQYENVGIEAELLAHPIAGLVIDLFIGSTTQGDLKVTNPDYRHAHHLKQKATLYGGLEANMMF